MTRDEHMAWAKQRALAYLEHGANYSPAEAVTSMLSDLSKHEQTRGIADKMASYGILFASSDGREARRFIEGFN